MFWRLLIVVSLFLVIVLSWCENKSTHLKKENNLQTSVQVDANSDSLSWENIQDTDLSVQDLQIETTQLEMDVDKAHNYIVSFVPKERCSLYSLFLSWWGDNFTRQISKVPYVLTGLKADTKYNYEVLCGKQIIIKGEFYTDKEKSENTNFSKLDSKPISVESYLPKLTYVGFFWKVVKLVFDKPVFLDKVDIYKYNVAIDLKVYSGVSKDAILSCLDELSTGGYLFNMPLTEFLVANKNKLTLSSFSGNCTDLVDKVLMNISQLDLSQEKDYNLFTTIKYSGDLSLLEYTLKSSVTFGTGRYKVISTYKFENYTWQSEYYIYNY